MEEYRRWEDSIKMDLKEIGVSVKILLELCTLEKVNDRHIV